MSASTRVPITIVVSQILALAGSIAAARYFETSFIQAGTLTVFALALVGVLIFRGA
jgi:hypothetical protein